MTNTTLSHAKTQMYKVRGEVKRFVWYQIWTNTKPTKLNLGAAIHYWYTRAFNGQKLKIVYKAVS